MCIGVRVLDPLKLNLQTVVSCLGTEPGRTASAPNAEPSLQHNTAVLIGSYYMAPTSWNLQYNPDSLELEVILLPPLLKCCDCKGVHAGPVISTLG